MTSAADRRAQQARANADAIDRASDWIRRRAAQEMYSARAAGEVGMAVAGLVEAVARSFRELPTDVAARALRVAAAVDRAEHPVEPRLPGAAT